MKFENFPFGGWNYYDCEKDAKNEIDKIYELGLNYTFSFQYNDKKCKKEDMIAFLDKAQEYGIKIIVPDWRISYNRYKKVGAEEYEKGVKQSVEDFGHHEAVVGFDLGDEPVGKDYEIYSKCIGIIRKYTHKIIWVNFNPHPHTLNYRVNIGVEDYFDFIGDFIQKENLDVISYDFYSNMISTNREVGKDRYFYNLNKFCELGRKLNKPVFNSVLAHGHWQYDQPLEKDIRWEISTSIAHGVKGIIFFALYKCLDYIMGSENSIFDFEKNKTEKFYYIKNQLKIFNKYYGEKFADLDLSKVRHINRTYGGTEPYGNYTMRYLDEVNTDEYTDGIVSEFYNEREDYYCYMIVNSNQEKGGVFELKFKEEFKKYNKVIKLLAGEFALIELKNKD